MLEEVQQTIIEALDAQCKMFARTFSSPISLETSLLGERSEIDSISLVMLIVDVEKAVQEKFGRTITVVNERAMAALSSPFRNVGSMANYVTRLVQGDGA